MLRQVLSLSFIIMLFYFIITTFLFVLYCSNYSRLLVICSVSCRVLCVIILYYLCIIILSLLFFNIFGCFDNGTCSYRIKHYHTALCYPSIPNYSTFYYVHYLTLFIDLLCSLQLLNFNLLLSLPINFPSSLYLISF